MCTNKRNSLIRTLICLLSFVAFFSQSFIYGQNITSNKYSNKLFNHLDLSLTLGTTGVGFDLASPLGNLFQLRTGFAIVPHFNATMDFGIEGGRYDENGNWIVTKFDKMADKLEDITGTRVDEVISLKGEPHYYNLKVLVDFFPFRNKKWHFTTGFYYGPSSVAKAFNTTEDMSSLLAVSIYNNIYQKIVDGKPIIGDDIYLAPDYEEKVLSYGRMGIHVGDKVSDGSPYMMVPDKDNMVKAEIKVNSFKPYIGFGYGGCLLKDNDRYHISFDCGAMFWGGTPRIITHDGTDLAKDVTNISGKVGDYVSFIKQIKVYPVISVRLTARLF